MMRLITMILAAALATAAVAAPSVSIRRTARGIIVVDDGEHVRALEPFSGQASGGTWYAGAVNSYRDAMPEGVNVFCMVIPTAVEFYCPEEAKAWTVAEKPVIDNIYSSLSPAVRAIDVYSVLQAHASEPIYARTDHHWSPLGAYYAAEEFARVAGIGFAPLDNYDRKVVRNFVGSMYYYSKDPAVKNDPEEFVYYVPQDSSYVTTYIGHNMGRNRRVTGITEPFEGPFFISYKDGSSSAYCTFMGGDTRTTHVATKSKNGRNLLVIKDSYGNALPGYLFDAFDDIHVVDFRYFTRNIVKYVKDNNITDILLVNNLQHAYAQSTSTALIKMLGKS